VGATSTDRIQILIFLKFFPIKNAAFSNYNLKFLKIFAIIYIENKERDLKVSLTIPAQTDPILKPINSPEITTDNLKKNRNSYIIYIESEERK